MDCWRWRCLCTLSIPGCCEHQATCPVSRVQVWPRSQTLTNQRTPEWAVGQSEGSMKWPQPPLMVSTLLRWSAHTDTAITTFQHITILCPLSQHYCLKDGCIKYKVSKLRHLGSDFLKSCNFPGTRPECVATSLSSADDDDRLQPVLMSSELCDCPRSNNENFALGAGDQ